MKKTEDEIRKQLIEHLDRSKIFEPAHTHEFEIFWNSIDKNCTGCISTVRKTSLGIVGV